MRKGKRYSLWINKIIENRLDFDVLKKNENNDEGEIFFLNSLVMEKYQKDYIRNLCITENLKDKDNWDIYNLNQKELNFYLKRMMVAKIQSKI